MTESLVGEFWNCFFNIEILVDVFFFFFLFLTELLSLSPSLL